MLTLLFEILHPPDPTPRKRYLSCNYPNNPRQVTACTGPRPQPCRPLVHPEMVVTVIDFATAIETYNSHRDCHAQSRNPSQRTPTAVQPPAYAVPWPVTARQAVHA